ncbi:MAG TPA: MBOAT family O-acyltransferase [Bacillaceae bacterium]|nr:MBOAT family O-acyltransferase [Paenibacillus bovis]HLU22772.1 MBOAT family O-acyltransferase [Bacillaceae bacterium]
MVFSSLLFLFFFLPVTLLLYFCSPMKIKNLVLLVVSLIFYAWGEPIYIFLMVFSACIDYFHGLYIAKFREHHKRKAKYILISSIVINIGLLSFFKYADFLIHNINQLFGTSMDPLQLPLPIGISFYTFQTMSYTIDVYRGRVQPQKNPIALAMYVCLFPQLIAGPIVRYEAIMNQLHNRTINQHQFSTGVKIFIIGLAKKVLLANNIGLLWNNIQSQELSEVTVLASWLGILAFAFQIYFDFSGYSDMAIGLGKMFGFNFPKNFDYPYMSKNISEFWRRWHMTLGGWFRDYVYIPLGGSRKGKIRLYKNTLIVWALTGFWHGASWNFMLWGIYFGIIIMIEKAGFLIVLNKLHPFFQRLYFVFFILISWVLFLFEDVSDGFQYYLIMFGVSDNPMWNGQFIYDLYTNIILFIILFIAVTPFVRTIHQQIIKKCGGIVQISSELIIYFLLLFLSTAFLVDASFNPFLYFRF